MTVSEIPVSARNDQLVAPVESSFTKALSIFQEAAKRIPAYKDFLHQHNINPAHIRTYQDFLTIPVTTKQNYLNKYPLESLVWDGDISAARIISMSSGSTGKPFLWPRGNKSTQDAKKILDELLANHFQTRSKSTLCINAYSMGTWIAGTYMLSAMTELANEGHKIVSITPGINHDEILTIIERLGDSFDQILLIGYAPFIKDTIETALERGIDLGRYTMRFIFSSEHISEKWRDYVLSKVSARATATDSLCLYGAADMGIIGMESAFVIYLRKIIDSDTQLFSRLFPDAPVLPTVVWYDPDLFFIEEIERQMIFTTDTLIPLVRYDLLDRGRVLSHNELIDALDEFGYKVPAPLLASPHYPIIALYGRADVSAMFYGLNIYPENIKQALDYQAFQSHITGKFVVKTTFDEQQQQSLHLFIELERSQIATEEMEQRILARVVEVVRKRNKEYNYLFEVIGDRAMPHIHLVPFGAGEFQIGRKHKWVQD